MSDWESDFDEDSYEAYAERRWDAVANGFNPDSEADMVAYDQMMAEFNGAVMAEVLARPEQERRYDLFAAEEW
jgi:hypothetical protein